MPINLLFTCKLLENFFANSNINWTKVKVLVTTTKFTIKDIIKCLQVSEWSKARSQDVSWQKTES